MIAGADCTSKKIDEYIDNYLYRWRYMYVDIYTGSGAWYEMAKYFDW